MKLVQNAGKQKEEIEEYQLIFESQNEAFEVKNFLQMEIETTLVKGTSFMMELLLESKKETQNALF